MAAIAEAARSARLAHSMMPPRALVVGGLGAIGSAVAAELRRGGFETVVTSRSGGPEALRLDPRELETDRRAVLSQLEPFDAVVWAQGENVNDHTGQLDLVATRSVLEANLFFVIETMDALVASRRLLPGARLVIISSIWEVVARGGKFSYTVSKSALGGLVRAAAIDLASAGVLVNAVLPGVVDTAMSRRLLSPSQLADVERATGHGRLVDLAAVTSTVHFLCSPSNTGITGQSIAVDLGFSVARQV